MSATQQHREGLATVDQMCDFLAIGRTTAYRMMNEKHVEFVELPGIEGRRVPWSRLRELAQGADNE